MKTVMGRFYARVRCASNDIIGADIGFVSFISIKYTLIELNRILFCVPAWQWLGGAQWK